MKSTTHRVVILNNVESKIISQAILILKNSEEFSDSSVIAEAERVVEKYMHKRKPDMNNKFSLIYSLMMICIGSFFGAVAMLYFV